MMPRLHYSSSFMDPGMRLIFHKVNVILLKADLNPKITDLIKTRADGECNWMRW
jgi:hypothetical protein